MEHKPLNNNPAGQKYTRDTNPVCACIVVVLVVVVVVVEIFIHGAVKATVTNAPQSQLNK